MNIKKIIAREGLLLLVPMLGIILFAKGTSIIEATRAIAGDGLFPIEHIIKMDAEGTFIQRGGKYLVIGYCCYQLIRFIFWAIKTLKEK